MRTTDERDIGITAAYLRVAAATAAVRDLEAHPLRGHQEWARLADSELAAAETDLDARRRTSRAAS